MKGQKTTKEQMEPQEAQPKRDRTKKRTLLISGIIVGVVLLIAFFALYQYSIKPMNTVVMQVGDSKLTMGYFLKRIMLSEEQDSLATLQNLMNEQILLEGSKQEPYSISVTDAQCDAYAKAIVGGEEGISDTEFREWFRQQVNESGLKESQYRDMIKAGLITEKMLEYFGSELAKGLEQVKLNVIMLDDAQVYESLKSRYEAGESFGSLAREYCSDPELVETSGEHGWVAPGELDDELDAAIFSLEVGKLSELIFLDEGVYAVFVVSEKDPKMQVGDSSLPLLREKALSDWLISVQRTLDIELYGLKGLGYDSETDAWVNWQISKMRERETGSGARQDS